MIHLINNFYYLKGTRDKQVKTPIGIIIFGGGISHSGWWFKTQYNLLEDGTAISKNSVSTVESLIRVWVLKKIKNKQRKKER